MMRISSVCWSWMMLFVGGPLLSTMAYRTSSLHPNRSGVQFSVDLTLPPLQGRTSCITKQHSSSSFGGGIHVSYTNDPATVATWLEQNVPSEEGCLIGFDVESVPKRSSQNGFSNPVVVQLSTHQTSLVVHLTDPSCKSSLLLLERILRDPSVIKVGCGIDMDMVELHAISPTVEGHSRFDLGRAFAGHTTPGLKTLVNEILGLELKKDIDICTSDWSQFPLSTEQIAYAAYDAWAGVAVATHLAAMQPELFGYEALRQNFVDQLTIPELYQRKVVRKRARSILTALLEPHKESSRFFGSSTLPSWKSRLVKELNAVLKANKHQVDRPISRLENVRNLTLVR